jgi:hypothetical protein
MLANNSRIFNYFEGLSHEIWLEVREELLAVMKTVNCFLDFSLKFKLFTGTYAMIF